MKSHDSVLPRPPRFAIIFILLTLLAPGSATADCSEEEQTAIFIMDGIYLNPNESEAPDPIKGRVQAEPKDTESFWQADTFNCDNLDSNTQDNHAWWCGALFEACNPGDPPQGYGNSWDQWLGWKGTVSDPSEPVTVTVRARMNLDSEPGYDFIHLQYINPEGAHTVWSRDGFVEGLNFEQTFTLQPEDLADPFDTVHLRWVFRSDGAWSDEDCLFSGAGAVQIDLIEVFFDQGAGPVQIGDTETCEPGSDLQWSFEIDELDTLRLSLLDVAPVGPVTNPSIAEMMAAVEIVQPGYNYEHMAQAGPFHLFYDEPCDWGGCAIVDGRDGRVLFAGTEVWLGQGAITYPVESSHPWSYPPGAPAAEPAAVEIIPNGNWYEQYGAPGEVTETALDLLQGSDVLRSFSDCGAYSVVSYIYTPEGIPGTVPYNASLVVIVSGHCGPPWAGSVSAVPSVSSDEGLTRVYPNPFNPRTKVSFNIDQPQWVRVTVHDLLGRRIIELTNQQYEAGEHSVEWLGRDEAGRAVPSGEYFFRVDHGGRVETRKVMLVR